MQRVKKNDLVEVIAGKDLGIRGEVMRVLVKEKRVMIEGLNLVKRHEKERPGPDGTSSIPAQIVEREAPVHISNVMVVCPSCDQKTRVGVRTRDDGYKTRYCKKCDSDLD